MDSQILEKWQTGTIIGQGQYKIHKKLTEGGFGVIYLAQNRQQQPVVLKVPSQAVGDDNCHPQLRQDFLNEAIRLARCSHHPHIVKIIELLEEDGLPCMVMEYIKGQNLSTIVSQRHLSEVEALRYIRQIGDALTCIHSQGLLHCDVKPQNIIIRDKKQEAVLIDFGIAREFARYARRCNSVSGSHGYTPIEQYYSQPKQGLYTDVHALAATLYFLLARQSPVSAQYRYQSMLSTKQDCLIPPNELNPKITERVSQAILKGMALKPKERPQTVQKWLSLLPATTSFPGIKSEPIILPLSRDLSPAVANA
jgi:serine/threonine-protein kinase